MKKEILFTFALLLFSNISITMDTNSADSKENSVETAKITIQITQKEYLKITSHGKAYLSTLKERLPGEEIQSAKDNLSEQEIQSAYVENPVHQIRQQLFNKSTQDWEIHRHYKHRKLFDHLENNEHLSLKVTYTPLGKNIKGAEE